MVDGIVHLAPDLAGQPIGFDQSAFERLASQEEGHYWFEPRNKLLTSLAAAFFPNARSYLEIGCGTGFVLRGFSCSRSWSRIVGSELHPNGLRYARRRLGGQAAFVQMDARKIPAKNAFDLVGAYDVLEHIEGDEQVMAGVHDSLPSGGGFIVAVPQHPQLWSAADEIGQHVRRYRPGELEAKLKGAGFDILFSTSYNALLLPLMALSRLGSADKVRQRAIHGEMEGPPIVNRLLRAILDFEVRITMRRFKWPAGGSRVVVARKPCHSLQ